MRDPDQWTMKAASVKGGALMWIEYHARRGETVTRQQFLEFFNGSPLSPPDWAEDLLSELKRSGLVEIDGNAQIRATPHADDWIRQARVWEEIVAALVKSYPGDPQTA